MREIKSSSFVYNEGINGNKVKEVDFIFKGMMKNSRNKRKSDNIEEVTPVKTLIFDLIDEAIVEDDATVEESILLPPVQVTITDQQVRSEFLNILWSIILTPQDILIDFQNYNNPNSIQRRTNYTLDLKKILFLFSERICDYFELCGKSFSVSTALSDDIMFDFLTPECKC